MVWENVNELIGWGSLIRTLYVARCTSQNYLIDKTGKIVARNIYGQELEKVIEKLANKNIHN